MLLFAIYDKKGCFYMPPFSVENKIQAIRGVEQEVNTSNSVLNRYPEDFALYNLGEFDNKTGRFKQDDILLLECECMQLVRPVRKWTAMPSADEPEAASAAGAAVRKE